MSLRPRFTGRLAALDEGARRQLLQRAQPEAQGAIVERVRAIGARVRAGGDQAVRALTLELDRIDLNRFEVPAVLVEGAPDRIDADLRRALERAARNLERVHRAFRPSEVVVECEPGVRIGRRPDPLTAVGVYAPGGRASYPSSVLMGVVPARVAGVREIVVCSPPQPSGRPSDAVLAAAAIGGATRVLAIGGAQAIFALAHGTTEVPRVDRIVGPGNSYVTEAKRQVAGFVGIDSPAGPSEILIIADDSASPSLIVRELVAQAEHDPEASCVALVTSPELEAAVVAELASHAPARVELVARAIAGNGAVLRIDSLAEAWAFAAEYAAEHVLLAIRNARDALAELRHAGTVIFGEGASVSFSDYLTGANHVLPTAGAGRSFSGLSTHDFMRFTTFQELSGAAAAAMAGDVGVLADAEGLPGHAAAARAHATADRASPPCGSGSALLNLSDNTNLRGAPPSACRVLSAQSAPLLAQYPSTDAAALKRAIARKHQVDPEEVVTGCGSDDVIECALRAFAAPRDRIAFPAPTFSMLPHFADTVGLQAASIPLLGRDREYDIDVDAMVASKPAIVYVCSPNNPTGTLVSRSAIDRLLAAGPKLVILDEAYAEYGGESGIGSLPIEPPLLIVRTLSKAYGLAGQRVGFGIGSRETVARIERFRGPYKVNGLGEQAAIAALDDDGGWVLDAVREVQDARRRFREWLEERRIGSLPSHANFLLLPVRDAQASARALLERGVGVRAFAALPGFGDCLRISVGPWELMERALAAFEEVLPCA